MIFNYPLYAKRSTLKKRDLLDSIVDRLAKKGMPRHCGLCDNLPNCNKNNPEDICKWLKASKLILSRFKIIIVLILFTNITSVFAAAPTVGTVSPLSGIGQIDVWQIFTTSYSDADGRQNFWNLNLLVNTNSTDRTNCAFTVYNPNTNQLFLFNDTWTTAIGGYAPGTNYIIENSYVRLDCSKTVVTSSGNTYLIKWALSFKSTFTGLKNTYLRAIDNDNNSTDFVKKGTWRIDSSPEVISVTPSSGASAAGSPVIFRAVYSDVDGWQNLASAYFVVNVVPDGANCLSGYYDQNSNKLYIRNDAKTAWLGGFAPGSSNIIQNSYVSVDCSKTKITASDCVLWIDWAVTFKLSFRGMKNIYLQVVDDVGAVSWGQKGTWNVKGDITAPIVNITEPMFDAVITDV